jgi:ribonuclease HI
MCTIPKGDYTCYASDHWYDWPQRTFPNTKDICVMSNMETIDDVLAYDLQRVFNSFSARKRITVNKPMSCLIKPKRRKRKVHLSTRNQTNILSTLSLPEIYTDASIVHADTGIGVWSHFYGISDMWRLSGMVDINRAELAALFIAMLKKKGGDVTFLTDSLTAIKLIQEEIVCDKYSCLVRCIRYLAENWKGHIRFRKVKGHSGNIGNDNADFLARYSINSKANIFTLPDDIAGADIPHDSLDDVIFTVKKINCL